MCVESVLGVSFFFSIEALCQLWLYERGGCFVGLLRNNTGHENPTRAYGVSTLVSSLSPE